MRRAAILVVLAALIGASPAAADRGRRRHPRAHPAKAAPKAAPVDSVDTRAAALREAGLERYLARDFELAAADLMEAYRLDGRETTLFDWAEAVRATGDLDLAVRLYRRLLARTTDPALADKATRGLAACTPPPPPPPMLARVPLAPPPRRPAPSPSHAGSYALIGTGVIAGLVGLGTYVSGDSGAPPGSTHDVVTAARSDGDWRRVIGASVAAGGAVIALVGVLRYRHDGRRERAIAIAPFGGADRVGVAMSGAF
ncbi:MAG: hypothetical protein K8W52_05760 [Deltaproteobacteria bacterium]|nr:hypothetical protein [Deltaproteobacteria bacterium]